MKGEHSKLSAFCAISMKIAICDDEVYWNDSLRDSVMQWAEDKKVNVECFSFYEPQSLIDKLGLNECIDLILLDISFREEMMDGIQAAEAIRQSGSEIPIVFVTAGMSRAADGYIVKAMGFIGKPPDKERLGLYLGRVLKQKESEKSIKIDTGTELAVISVEDIAYLEVIDHTLIYHTIRGDIELRGSLRDALILLESDSFIQVHRSYAVSVEKIHSIRKRRPYSANLYIGFKIISIPVSRKYVSALSIAYAKAVIGQII
ncbi:MAG: LytTR family DNA-binding domain-containing protein [Eubacteriaceae bacterium]|nr:LytTR family DNA-binding domain-containing protein [Eubacteriaceae bacterium]